MKKTPSHFMACVEIEQQISFFSFGFARVSKVRHIENTKHAETNSESCRRENTNKTDH